MCNFSMSLIGYSVDRTPIDNRYLINVSKSVKNRRSTEKTKKQWNPRISILHQSWESQLIMCDESPSILHTISILTATLLYATVLCNREYNQIYGAFNTRILTNLVFLFQTPSRRLQVVLTPDILANLSRPTTGHDQNFYKVCRWKHDWFVDHHNADYL